MAGSGNNNSKGFQGPLQPYFGYVVTLARKAFQEMPKHLKHRLEREDLIQDGFVGLLEAAWRFDAGREAGFLTYAHYRIWGAIRQSLKKARRLPEHLEEFAMENKDGDMLCPLDNLQAPEPDPEQQARYGDLLASLEKALAKLDEHERELLRQRFVENQTMQSMADNQGLSVAAIFHRLQKVTGKLRKSLEGDGYQSNDLPENPEQAWLVNLGAAAATEGGR